MMKIVLMVAETPILASSVADVLSNGNSVSTESLNSALPLHKWYGEFFGEPAIFKMVSICKDLMTLDFGVKFKFRNDVDPKKLFSCPIVQREKLPDEHIIHMLSYAASGADYLVLWFNNDEKGENVCFEVINAVKNSMHRSENINRYWRAIFSSISEKDIKAAMERLYIPRFNKSLSVDARNEINLRVRCAFTRFQTKYFHGKYNDLDTSLISYDLCQIPTLGFCVQRYDEIQRFRPEKYFIVQPTIKLKDGQNLKLSWKRGKCFDRDMSNGLFETLKMQKTATVVSITHQVQSKSRPLPLNYMELIRAASSELKMDPSYTLQVADYLYLKGFISTPLTRSCFYSEDFNPCDVIITLMNTEYGKKKYQVLKNILNKPNNGKKFEDQLPITPLKLEFHDQLQGDAWYLYDLIVRRFLATFSNDCKYYSHTVTFKIGTEYFMYNWKTLIDVGFTAIIPKEALLTDELAVNFECNDKLSIQDIRLIGEMTNPSSYLTESDLILMMEKHKIGINLSIATHIDFLKRHNYVTITSKRQLIPTDWGIVLVYAYQKIDKELVEPIMQSSIEDQLALIASGKANYYEVVKQVIQAVQQKYLYFVKNIHAMDSVFSCKFVSISSTTGKAFSRCGKCQCYMILISEKLSCLQCLNCDKTYDLPTEGQFKINNESKCPLDGFELITWSMGNKGQSCSLCPYCYNEPGFKNMEVHSGCDRCLHPTCPKGLYVNGIASCFQCDDGTLVLDPSSGPKWKIECNRCDVIICLFECVHKIIIENNKECYCGAQLLKIKFKEDLREWTGCLFCCDWFFDHLVENCNAENFSHMLKIRQNRMNETPGNRRPHGRVCQVGLAEQF